MKLEINMIVKDARESADFNENLLEEIEEFQSLS